MASNPRAQPRQQINLTPDDLQDPSLGNLNQLFSQMQQQINELTGAAGPVKLPAGVDVQGATVTNIAPPISPGDAVSSAHAEANYSAKALVPKLSSGGKNALTGFRALNSKSQQENYSTFLNKLSNTSPTTNSTVVTAGAVSGGSITITIPAGFHQFPDGSVTPFATFTDTVAAPPGQFITHLTRAAGISTATGTFTGLTVGESIYISQASDPSFDATVTLLTASGSTFTYAQPGEPDVTTPATGAIFSTGGVYYFFLRYPSQVLAVDGGPTGGGYPSDTQQSRLSSNRDGQVLIAVAVVNSSGLVFQQSAAGATPPAATDGNRIVSRL